MLGKGHIAQVARRAARTAWVTAATLGVLGAFARAQDPAPNPGADPDRRPDAEDFSKPSAAPIASAGRPVTILVTAPIGDGGVKDAEVIVLDYSQCKEEWGPLKITPLFSDFEELRRKVGLKMTTDFGGTVIVPRPALKSYITVRAAGQFGFSQLDSTDASPFIVKMEVDQVLDVSVVDTTGKPLVGMHVGVTMPTSVDIKTRLDEDKELWMTEGATGPDGIAHLEHLQWWKTPPHKTLRDHPNPTRVSIAPLFAELVRAPVDLEHPPKSPVKLVVGPSGSVIVPMPKGMRAYARVRAAVPMSDPEKQRPWPSKVPYRVESTDGRAVFPYVGLGLDLDYEVWWTGLLAPRRGTAKGPTQAGEQVTLPRLDTFANDDEKPKPPPTPPKKPK